MTSGSNMYKMFSYSSTALLLLLIRLLSSSIYAVEAQASPPPDDFEYARFSPSMAIIVVVLVAALFFMGFFSIYIRRCSDGGPSAGPGLSIRRAGRLAATSRGLDAAVLETFPTFAYSTVKGLKVGKGALECAVCLNEFDDEETIRLIPKCDHVFHAECIDAWLENHVTCPVCRCNLVQLPGGDSIELPENNSQTTVVEFNEENSSTVVISVGDENVLHRNPVLDRVKSATASRAPRSRSVRAQDFFQKFRSHSTGHSLVQAGENTERFTLRLPEEVRKKVISDALLYRSGSTVKLTGEESGRKGYRTGEGSSNRRSYRRMGSLDRPVFSRAPSFLSRAFSSRSQKGVSGNGGSSSEMMSDKIPLNNIGLKSDDGRPPV